MKDIYSPLEIDEEWDNYAPAADGSSTALMERPGGAKATTVPVTPPDDMSKSNVMPGINDSPGDGTKEPDQSSIAHDTAEAPIDKPTTNTDTFDISDTNSSPTPDPSGLVSITPGGLTPEPTSGETTPGETNPETTIAGTPHEMIPVNVNVTGGETTDSNDTLPDPNFMGGEAADSGVKLPEVVDQSNGGTSSPDVPVISPFIAPVVPGEDPKEETDEQTDEGDSDVVFDTGTITPDTGEKSTDTIKASDDDDGESNDDMVENSESDTADDTDDTESDTAGSLSEVKADKPKVEKKVKAPASGGTTIEEFKSNLYKTLHTLGEERSETLASIEAMEKDKKKYTDDYNEDMAAIGDGIKAANEKLADHDKFIAQLESFK